MSHSYLAAYYKSKIYSMIVSELLVTNSIIKSDWWFGTWFIFPFIGNVIIPTDEHIFQDGYKISKFNRKKGVELIELIELAIFF